jgi:hypothetical protein
VGGHKPNLATTKKYKNQPLKGYYNNNQLTHT